MRKKISMILCSLLALSCVCNFGCGGAGGGETSSSASTSSSGSDSSGGNDYTDADVTAPEGIPTYADSDEQYFIGGYCEPRKLDKATWQLVADCNLNYIYIDPWLNGTNLQTEQNIVKAIELCGEVGIKGLIMPNNTHDNEDPSTYISYSAYQVDYSQYEGFGGFYAFDEPNSTQFDWIAEDYQYFKNRYPDKDYLYFVTMMGGDHAENPIANKDDFFQAYVDKVFSKYEEHTRILSFDCYPLMYSRKYGYNRINEGFVGYLDRATHYAHQNGGKFYNFVQTIGYGWGEHRLPSRIEDIRWQVGASMAFGAEGVQCFTFSQLDNAGFEGCVLTAAGKTTDIYDFCKQTFSEIRAWEDVYLAFDYKGTMCNDTVAKSQTEMHNENDVSDLRLCKVESHPRIKSIESERDLLIGTFKDENGYDGFLFNSYVDPYYRKTNQIEVEFRKASKAVVYLNGVRSEVDLQKGVFKYEMQASDVLFVIPVV